MDPTGLDSLDLATLTLYLAEAIDARHKLGTGAQLVSVGWADRRTQYTPANLADLNAYIAQLQRAVDRKTTGRPAAAPVVVGF